MRENRSVQEKGALFILLLPVFINHGFFRAEASAVSPTLVQEIDQDDSDPYPTNDTGRDRLRCNTDNPPRVTSSKISGHGLKGQIPDANRLQALETINVDPNNLPGNLPNLKLLNLSSNNLDNKVPSTLNNRITIHDSMNDQSYSPNYSDSDGDKRDPLDALWSLVGLAIICVGIWWCCCRTPVVVVQPQHNPGPVIEIEEVEVVSQTRVNRPEVVPHTVVGQPVVGQPVYGPVTTVGHTQSTTVTMG